MISVSINGNYPVILEYDFDMYLQDLLSYYLSKKQVFEINFVVEFGVEMAQASSIMLCLMPDYSMLPNLYT